MRAVQQRKHKFGASYRLNLKITGMAAERPEFFEIHGLYIV
jgi:hypothetical protein